MSARQPIVTPAELAVAGLSVVTTLTFWRLFVDSSYVGPLVGAALAAHVLCWWMRRAGLSLVLALPVWALAAVLFITEVWYRSTTRVLLPTRATWHAAQDDLSAMAKTFGTAVAPVPATTGYLVVAAIGLWLVAFAADTLAFRAFGGVEAVLPAGVGFVMSSALGDGRRMLLATALWAGTAMLAVALLRAQRARATGVWLTARRDTAIANAARWAAVIGVVALVAGIVVGPRLPGSEAKALIDTRSSGEDGSRVTVSPLVDIKSRLSTRSSTTAFRVRTERPSYMRLASLDEFDGQRWTPSFDYESVPAALDPALIAGVTTEVTQVVTIDKLGRTYVPAAFTPVSVRASRKVQWDADLQTIVVSSGELRGGDSFTVVSAVPDKTKLTAGLLTGAAGAVPADVAERYTALPERTRRRVLEEAVRITLGAAAGTPYDSAIALQNWFRDNFTYSLSVPSGSGTSAIDAFLNAREGYCEQFAGTFAAMARSLDIPARVAVGFTQGTRQADGTYVVEGKHAHAWPEVYIGGIGWVPFEPTPGRGNPDAEQYTGVPTQQEGEGPVLEAEPTATTTPGSTILPRTPSDGIIDFPTGPPGGGGIGTPAEPGPPTWLLGLAVGAAAAAVALAVWMLVVRWLYRRRWSRRVDAAPTPAHRVVVSWHHTLDELRNAGFRYRPQDTPTEVARRLSDAESLGGAKLDRMARHVTIAAYATSQPADDVLEEVQAIHADVAQRAAKVGSRRDRFLRRLDPRPLWRALPGEVAHDTRWSRDDAD